ncbi:MAG: hypothetical protein ACT4O1_10190 [Gemmatimonadota bacterium]
MTARGKSAGSTGIERSWPERIQNMIAIGKLRPQESSREAVAAVWSKAVASARDAEWPNLSVDTSLRVAYDAGHMAAIALLAAHGLRTGQGSGHHEAAFAGAAALGLDELSDLVPDSMEIRALRKGSMYDPVIAGPEERKLALAWVRRTLPAIRNALITTDPKLAKNLETYP